MRRATVFTLSTMMLALSIGTAVAEDKAQGSVKETAKDVGHSAGTAAREVGHGTKKASKEVGQAVTEAARETGHAFRDGAKEFKKAVHGESKAANKETSKKKDK